MVEYHYQHDDDEHAIRVEQQADGSYTAHNGERVYRVEVQRAGQGQLTLLIDGQRVHAYVASHKSAQSSLRHHYIALAGSEVTTYQLTTASQQAARRSRSACSASLTAQVPGQVMAVLVSEGDSVEEGQPLIILEAMKMEIQMAAPYAGTVANLTVQEGDTVERGQQLAEIVSE